jgi:SPP1 gp7 family putative phage head morphogenesis protein
MIKSNVVQLNRFKKKKSAEVDGRSLGISLSLPSLAMINAELQSRRKKSIPASFPSDLPALSRIASRLEPAMRRIFINAVNATKNVIDLEALAQAIQNGRVATRLNALAQLETFERRLAGYEGPLRKGFLRGARFANTTLTQAGVTMNFELMNTHAAEFSRKFVPPLVQTIVEKGREQVQQVITDAVTFGDTPDRAARRIRRSIGFTKRDGAVYSKIEKELEEANLAGELSDRQLEQKLERVANGLVSRRAKTIARTEIIRATNGGQIALWNEASNQGLIDKRTTRKKWIATDDELLEAICRGLDGDEVKLDEAFDDGSMHPPSHPNCRCAMSLVFKD